MADYAVKKIDDMDAALFGSFKRARAELGVESFGMQVIDLPPSFDGYPSHDHTHDDQEEVFVFLNGEATIVIDGTEQFRCGKPEALPGTPVLGCHRAKALSLLRPVGTVRIA